MIEKREKGWYVEEVKVDDIASRFGTPLYIYSQRTLLENIQRVRDVFHEISVQIGFACKANDNIHLMRLMLEQGCALDVVGKGEYMLARHAGAAPESIVVNGNGVTPEEMRFFLKEGVYSINIDSVEAYECMADVVEEISGPLKSLLFLRVNPDVDPLVHPYVSTGLKKSKFGIPLEQAAAILKHDKIGISGIHAHIGSNLQEVSPFAQAFEKMVAFFQSHPKIRHVNIGGGWGIDYLRDGKSFSTEAYRQKALPFLKSFQPPVLMELGRFLAGNAGILLSRCLYHKRGQWKRFVVCDTNMAHLIRPALYQSHHQVLPLVMQGSQREKVVCDVVGGLCESGDVLATDRELEEVNAGELLAIMDAGAYGYSMASNYNAALRPAEVLIHGDTCRVIRRRETTEDLLRLMEV